MEEPPKVFHPLSKDPLKFLPVSSNLKGKFRVWGTPNHLKWDFGAKSGKNDSLPKSTKIINFHDFCENGSKIVLTHQGEAPKLALTQGIPMLSYSNVLAPCYFSAMGQEPRKGRLLPLKPMGKVVLKERSMSSLSHDPAEKAHIVSDLKKIRLYPPPPSLLRETV